MPLSPITEVQISDLVTTLANTVEVAANGGFIPKITGITYTDNDTAANTSGGETLTINGANFNGNSRIWLDNSVIVPTLVNSAALSFTSPAKAANMYSLYVVNDDGAAAILLPGIVYSNTPVWSTTAGSLGTGYEATSFNASLSGTGDAPVTFAVSAGNTLPTGLTLASNGYLSGTLPNVENNTTFTFYIDVVDAENQESSRQFSITVLRDVVTWASPVANTAYTFRVGEANSVTLTAFSLSGASITYSTDSGTLPANVSFSGTLLSGTATTSMANNLVVIRATATGSNKFATRSFYIKATPLQIQATGGTITQSGDYRLHTFSSNDTFTVETTFAGGNVEYLIAAGGGAGGAGFLGVGGGGGCGGVLLGNCSVADSTAYGIVVGSGGTVSAASNPNQGNPGGNSSFNAIVAYGGGGGGGFGGNGVGGANYGGGGGGGQYNTQGGSAGQGFAGGTGGFNPVSGNHADGGGGGMAQAGSNGNAGANNGSGYTAGVGGAGIYSSISGSNTAYGGGGGGYSGGVGGVGGGGNAGSQGVDGTGGGGGSNARGGNGIVIIRYPYTEVA